MAYTRIDTNDILDGAIKPGDVDLSGSSVWSFQGQLSGSIQRTAAGISFIAAGAGVTVTSASNGQVTISATGGGLTVANFINGEIITGSDGVITSFTLASTPAPSTSLRVFKNGLRMMSGSTADYMLTGSAVKTLTFNAGAIPTSGSNIVVDYMI